MSDVIISFVQGVSSKSKKRASTSSDPSEPAFKKTAIYSNMKKTTASELFGNDSGDEEEQKRGKKKLTPLYSSISTRVANGTSRKTDDSKSGSHYVELKIYKCDEVEHVSPMNRWRHAIISIKNKTYENTEAWRLLSNYINATRKEFKNCPPTFVGAYY